MKSFSCLIVCLLPLTLFAQTFQQEINTIPVIRDGHQLQYPWNGGFNSLSIAMPDLDGDGDADLLFTGSDEGHLHYYRNTSEGITPDFTFENSWLSELEFGIQNTRLAMDDLDFDGNTDLIVGDNYGLLHYYRNDGDSSDPEFTLFSDYFDSLDIGYQAAPTFADLNGDGLNDLVIGSYDNDIHYFTRDDSNSTSFSPADTLRDPDGIIISPGGIMSVPAFVDIDNDGDLDLFAGSSSNKLAFYLNTGSKFAPQFTLIDDQYITPPDFISFITPVFIDIDSDLDYDLFFGSNHGYVSFYRNQGSAAEADFVLENVQLPLEFLDFGFYGSPYFLDIDNDNDKDLLVSTDHGAFHYLENTGTSTQPAFEYITDHFENIAPQGFTQAWGDLDNDNDFDLLYCSNNGPVYYYENIGDRNTMQLDSIGILLDSLGNQILGGRPELADIDSDNDLDLFMNVNYQSEDVIKTYHNVGSPDSMIFVAGDTLRDESGEIISFFDGFFRFTDSDGDDSLDLFIGHGAQTIWRYKITGPPETPRFRLLDSYFAGVVVNNDRILPFLTDIDGDGQMDLFYGRFRGGLLFYHNTTAADINMIPDKNPIDFNLKQNYPNPFNPVTMINYQLTMTSDVQLSIYNLLGQKVATLVNNRQQAGYHRVEWDATGFASGIYYYQLKAGGFRDVKKMVLIK